MLVLFGITSSEANTSRMPLAGDENRSAIIASPEIGTWNIGHCAYEAIGKPHINLSRPECPDRIRRVMAALPAAPFEATLSPDSLHFSPSQWHDDGADLESRPQVVPIPSPPASGPLFMTALVGMLVTPLLKDSRRKQSCDPNGCQAHRPGSARLVVLLSADATFAETLEKHLHRAGYAIRTVSTTSEIFAIMDPASLVLILVDHRIHDWDMLRTDPSLRHVLLMGVVPFGSLYTENHCVADLERGLDGIHDLRDGHRLLVTKVRAYLRRDGCGHVRRGIYQVGAIELDDDAHEVTIAGRQVKLSTKPFTILRLLMSKPSEVCSRSELVHFIWGPNFAIGEHALDVHVYALRQQLDRAPNSLCKLITIKGVGFKLKPLSSTGTIQTRTRSSKIQLDLRIAQKLKDDAEVCIGSDPQLKSPAHLCSTPACG